MGILIATNSSTLNNVKLSSYLYILVQATCIVVSQQEKRWVGDPSAMRFFHSKYLQSDESPNPNSRFAFVPGLFPGLFPGVWSRIVFRRGNYSQSGAWISPNASTKLQIFGPDPNSRKL